VAHRLVSYNPLSVIPAEREARVPESITTIIRDIATAGVMGPGTRGLRPLGRDDA
jgi:hypothetical protein